MEAEGHLHVVATAGHVDHGKSALILRLTGMDPDRLPEEKRRGLTIDLGFAWTRLPSGQEVGFVDVPGHERFVRNMLAGVGPTRLVLFVVAADEGWKPQSEEHLQIVDVLGAGGAVVALTKRDLVEDDALEERRQEVAERLRGTRLEEAPIVPCSAATGEGIEEVAARLGEMLAAVPPPHPDGRPRQFLDRVFTIRGAGTVVTGTLTGGRLAVGDEVEILPSGHRARIRGLQTHKRALDVAHPVSRVAVNLSGAPRSQLERGDVLARPGQWRATSTFDAWLRPVRGLDRPLTSRGAYKLYAGSAERDASIRLLDTAAVSGGGGAFARIRVSRPVALDVTDPFVVRDIGRQETVAGGEVLDVDPPARPGPDAGQRLQARRDADRASLAWITVRDRGAVRAAEVPLLSGAPASEAERRGALRLDSWVVAPELRARAAKVLEARLAAHHVDHPLTRGLDVAEVRLVLAEVHPAFSDPGLTDALLVHLVGQGRLAREGPAVRLSSHHASTAGRADADRLVEAVRAGEPNAPTVRELAAAGFAPELIAATCADGRLVRLSREIVATPEFVRAAEAALRDRTSDRGITVSAFREAIGTSRKYALPILEYFDAKGLTTRRGDVRILRR